MFYFLTFFKGGILGYTLIQMESCDRLVLSDRRFGSDGNVPSVRCPVTQPPDLGATALSFFYLYLLN